MPIYDVRNGLSYAERRNAARIRLTAPVEVHLPSGMRRGKMRDLSEIGAMVVIDIPPTEGATVMLRWSTPDDRWHEVYGWVMWSDAKGCGLKFARGISAALVLETSGQDSADNTAPAADHANIPLGRKRSRLA